NGATVSQTTTATGTQLLPPLAATLTVNSTTGFPSSGWVSVLGTAGGLQTIAYGAKGSGTTFNSTYGTQILTSAVGQVLPVSGTYVLNVASTEGFPATSGTLAVPNS